MHINQRMLPIRTGKTKIFVSIHWVWTNVLLRVSKEDLLRLEEALQVPRRFRRAQGTVCSGLEGLCILLERLAYPCKLYDMVYRFARPVPDFCTLHNVVLDWVFDNHCHRLTFWKQQFLTPACLEQYAQTIRCMGSPLPNCFGFVDGTVRPISRPDENQRLVYNGHKRVHALKFQSLVVPNGLDKSGLLTLLRPHCHISAGHQLCIYGDPEYPLRPNSCVRSEREIIQDHWRQTW